jgi:hypothetical protein
MSKTKKYLPALCLALAVGSAFAQGKSVDNWSIKDPRGAQAQSNAAPDSFQTLLLRYFGLLD